jgi:hypothetical protein
MDVNPYQAPREAAKQEGYDWWHLCLRSALWSSGIFFAAWFVTATMSPKPHTVAFAIVVWIGAVTAWGFMAAVILSIIAAIGWVISKKPR